MARDYVSDRMQENGDYGVLGTGYWFAVPERRPVSGRGTSPYYPTVSECCAAMARLDVGNQRLGQVQLG